LSALRNIPPNPEPPSIVSKKRSARWQHITLWIAALLAGLVAIIVVGIAALLHSQRFHSYSLTEFQRSASESLSVQVELQNYALHFDGISPTVDLYGLVVHGAAPYSNPPLLQAQQARIGVQVVSLLRQRWYLSEVTIHHPVVQVRIDANGNNNLPKPKPEQKNSSSGVQAIFDLAIRHALLDGGEIYYNDRKSALYADLRELMLNATFDPARNVYAGQIAYSDGHLKSGVYEPIPHQLSAEFEMTPVHLDIRKAELRSGASLVAFTATVDDFNNPRVTTVYHASADATELRRLLHNADLPLGVVKLDGHAEYAAKPNQPALNSTTLNGTLRSDRLELRAHNMRAEARAIQATYSLVNGDAEVRSLSAALLSGTVDAKATVRNLAGEQTGALHVKLDGISLGALRQLGSMSTPSNLTLEGKVQAVGDASWKGSPSNLLATADVTVDAEAGSTQSFSTVPIKGAIHASFRNSDQQLTLRQSYFRTARTLLTLDGSTGQRSLMNLALNAEDLHEFETIAGIFRKPAQPIGLYGSATFKGSVSGPTSEPRLTGGLNVANLQLRGTDWRLLRAHLDASPSSAEIQNGQLEPVTIKGGPPANINFSGRAALNHWKLSQNSPFQLNVKAERLDAAQLARLAGSTTPVSGTLSFDMQAHGTQLHPIGRGRLELVRAAIAGEPIQSALVQLDGDGNAAHASLNITLPAGITTGSVTYYPKERGYEAQLETHDFRLDQLQVVKAHNLSIAGVMNLVANGRGTLDDPQLTASLDIPQLKAQGQTIDRLSLQANVVKHVANVSLDTRAVNANIRGQAKVQLSGDYETDAVLDTQPIPLQPLLARYAPSQAENVTGQAEIHATLRGPLKHRERIEAHIVIPELNLHYQKSIDLAATGPIHADYLKGVLTVQRSGLKGTGTDLQFQGSLPLLDRAKPVALLLLGSMDLSLAQLFDPDVTSSGQLRFNINSYGARSDPNFQGDVRIVNANFATIDAPFGLSNGNGTLALTRDRLNITSFEGIVGGGTVTARGGVVYHPSLQFDIALAGKGVRLLYPDGVREGLSADLSLTGTPDRATLRGQVNVDQLSFTPDFDLSNLTSLTSGVEEPPSRGFLSNLQMNVSLRSSQNLSVVSRVGGSANVSVSGSANLRVTGTAAQPVLLGRINLTGGDLIFQGNRYLLQNGVVEFVNPSRTEPNVNAALTTTIQQYNIAMRFQGPLERLRTSYSSDPALPPADIINLIAFGKTQEAQAATSTPLSQTAEQSIASEVTGQVTSRVQKFAGISHLSVDPTLGNNQQNAGATVTVQQRVTSKIFVTFSTDVTSTQRQVVQLEYQATPRVSVSGTRDQNGGFGFDTRITREW
jgi:translocation and assembly module TamB